MWWPGTESNRRRQPFQGCALPTELPGRGNLSVATPLRLLQCFQHFARLPLDVGMQTVAMRVHGHDGGEVLDAEAPRAFDEPLLRLTRKKRPPFAPKLLCCHSVAGFCGRPLINSIPQVSVTSNLYCVVCLSGLVTVNIVA